MKRQQGIFQNFVKMNFKDPMILIQDCGVSLVLFELLYKFFPMAIVYPLLVEGFHFTLREAGFRYLTNDYIITYLTSPYTIVFLLLIILFSITYILYEIICLSVIFDAGHNHKKLTVPGVFVAGFYMFRSVMHRKKLSFVIHGLVVSLMMNAMIIIYMLSGIKLPDAAVRTITAHPYVIWIVILGLFCFFIYCVFYIFAINFMLYDASDIRNARKQSRRLIRKKEWKSIGAMLFWNLMVLVAIYTSYFALMLLISIGGVIFDDHRMALVVFLNISKIVLMLVRFILMVVSVPLSYALITSMFYSYTRITGENSSNGRIDLCTIKDLSRQPKKQHMICVAVMLISLGLNLFYVVLAFDTNPFSEVEYFTDTKVMAHRGSSYDAPENTMLAFQHAIDETMDYIELDVHETKDGEVVVMHDASLYRTTGINKNIWEVTYDEIKDVDVGSWFGDKEEYSLCRIPTLRQVLELAKGKIKLNIEIKQGNYEPDLVKSVYDLLEEYDYKEDCVITSMKYEVLKEMKSYDTSIRTGYILTMAYGGFYNISDVDAFSINASYVNKSIVDAIHNRGKQIFVWTVNSESAVRNMTAMGVDGVITDNPVMAKNTIEAKYTSPLIQNIISYVFNQ